MAELFLILMSNFGVDFGVHPLLRLLMFISIIGLPLYFLNFIIASILSFTIFTITHYLGNKTPEGELSPQEKKVYIITGVSENGIGYFMAQKVLKLGATVILACRNVKKTQELIPNLIKETNNKNIHVLELDCSSMKSIGSFVKEFKSKFDTLDVLINNAGVNTINKTSEDGFELITAINYLSVYSLSILLLDMLKKSNGRIITTSSEAQGYVFDTNFDDWKTDITDSYGRSKLYVNMFTKELQNRLNSEGSKVSVFSFHPGVVFTEIWGKLFPKLIQILFLNYFWLRMRTPEEGASCGVFLSTNENVTENGGEYFNRNKIFPVNQLAEDEKLRKELWNKTKKIHEKYFQ